ncbi:nuclear transport factor 2 family protein [Catenuloplanes atrovinosus]|uniref:Ketosteroid isomerase-like protein n=1 Tax=Catenuloplanes atrovinosus TaxID=137266 RepID=A0AAE3YRE5_9ACTN|nr:nuclear transport factor 2 family protein [Catenuloplanes atrovinosus]MDR7277068.1 ketosteroid isomerase-like protein [Catenuloplanes atrovinosus]
MSDDDSVRRATQHVFRDHLDLLAAGRGEDWVDLFTEDGAVEFPYAPAGYPARVAGRQRLLAHVTSFAENFRVTFSEPRFHDTVDPTLVIAEVSGTGVARRTGRPYHQAFICVVETTGGRMSRFVDYWNPQVVADALGGTDGMVSAFTTR